MSQSTVVSLVPFSIPCRKSGLLPFEYLIPEYKGGPCAVLIVENGSRSIYLDHDRGSEGVIVHSEEIANALVADYSVSQPGQDDDGGPGLFWVKKAHTAKEVGEKFPQRIKNALEMQKRWWGTLVRLADDTWTAGHKFSQIGDLDRTACRELGLKRDWLDDSPDKITKCLACTTLISTEAVVCFACHAVLKQEEYKKIQFTGDPVQAVNS